jgi:hypothetical protein
MSRHTPGPWVWQPNRGGQFYLARTCGRDLVVDIVVADDIPHLATTEKGALRPMTPDVANAKLIAKAPELLAMLQEAELALTLAAVGQDTDLLRRIRQTIKQADG